MHYLQSSSWPLEVFVAADGPISWGCDAVLPSKSLLIACPLDSSVGRVGWAAVLGWSPVNTESSTINVEAHNKIHAVHSLSFSVSLCLSWSVLWVAKFMYYDQWSKFIKVLSCTLTKKINSPSKKCTLFHNETIVRSCVATSSFFRWFNYRQLIRRNLCFERLPSPSPDIRRADSTCILVNILSSPARLFSSLFTKGTASVVRTAIQTPKWQAVYTSADTICSACKNEIMKLQVLEQTCANSIGGDILKCLSQGVKKILYQLLGIFLLHQILPWLPRIRSYAWGGKWSHIFCKELPTILFNKQSSIRRNNDLGELWSLQHLADNYGNNPTDFTSIK